MGNAIKQGHLEAILLLGVSRVVDLVKESVFAKLLLEPVGQQEITYLLHRKAVQRGYGVFFTEVFF